MSIVLSNIYPIISSQRPYCNKRLRIVRIALKKFMVQYFEVFPFITLRKIR